MCKSHVTYYTLDSSIKKGMKLHESLFDYKRTLTKKESIPYYEFKDNISAINIEKGAILTSKMIQTRNKVAAVMNLDLIILNIYYAKIIIC